MATTAFAILAPVPEEHLVDGCDVCQEKGKVAFGSRAWEVFREADRERAGQPVEVLLYASHLVDGGRSRAVVTWRAEYIGHVETKTGAHPAGMQYRPPSTAKYESDNAGHWAVFWEVAELRRVPPDQQVEISSLRGVGKKKYYGKDFVPEGPLRIEYPYADRSA